MKSPAAISARSVIVKTTITHTLTYLVVGVTAYAFWNYPALIADTELGLLMRPLAHPLVLAGPFLQPIRGSLFGLVFYLLRVPFFGSPRGWLLMWFTLAAIGILGTFGAPPGSIEGAIYTVMPLRLHLIVLSELMAQSLLLSYLVFQWVNHSERRRLN